MAAQRQWQGIPLQILTIIDAPATARLASKRSHAGEARAMRGAPLGPGQMAPSDKRIVGINNLS